MTATTKSPFAKTISALRTKNQSDWQLGDALLEEVPAGYGRGHKNGSSFAWERLETTLAAEGVDVSVSTLRQYRDAAAYWTPDKRVPGVSFGAHRAILGVRKQRLVPEDQLKTLMADRKASGKSGGITVSEVQAHVRAVNTPAKTQTASSHLGTLTELEKVIAKAEDKDFISWLAREVVKTPAVLARVEGLARTMPKAWSAVQGTIPASATPTTTPAPTGPKSSPKASSATAAKTPARKGRTRGI